MLCTIVLFMLTLKTNLKEAIGMTQGKIINNNLAMKVANEQIKFAQ